VSGNNDFAGTNATTLTTAPSRLTAGAGNAVVHLSWTAPAGAVRYKVYRGTAAGAERLLATVTTTTFTDTSVTDGRTYFYVVTALNGNATPLPAESARSNEVSARPAHAAGTAPTLLTAGGEAASGDTADVSGPPVQEHHHHAGPRRRFRRGHRARPGRGIRPHDARARDSATR
jgi:hypothetical protein